MEDDAGPEPGDDPGDGATPVPAPADPANRWAPRLRRLVARNGDYAGPILAVTRAWVSRDGKHHAFAARFLDFAVLTPEHLVLCSTGFFTRRPRHAVLREPLNRLAVVPLGPEPARRLRVVGDFSRPLLLELRDNPDAIGVRRALLDHTRTDPRVTRDVGTNEPADERTPTP